jgi:hypothetical protein
LNTGNTIIDRYVLNSGKATQESGTHFCHKFFFGIFTIAKPANIIIKPI